MYEKILRGKKQSPLQESLYDFEHISPEVWATIRLNCRIPDGFLFLAGTIKYPRRWRKQAPLRFGKDQIFVQNLLPHSSNGGVYQTRGYGALYSFYEPSKLESDDLVLSTSAIYQTHRGDYVKLVLAPGEHRKAEAVAEMFRDICQERQLVDFAELGSLPLLYEVTFERSCGYFLQGRTYHVWAKPIGIPDQQSGDLTKGWLLCDVNCGVPAVMKEDRETFKPIPAGEKVGLFTLRDHELIYEG